ncbi:glycoside hydrolase family 3 C-terminal domain-containing protein [Kineothrix sp. MSJ-39]|jgi:beta-glucosidase|uniref:glycoside hydrolase family 3 C-terminal domain-containing protein n=1 Tax=Kineothrix sp. MSJ-39 TaxID=2841533 RepID=UPI001C0FEBA2|nr:glycoside hydrolase family 3 C-terminal domain-containing protein [Kineothrix sp. MSJ-39]MBU5429035.1 glycoside hydrolase family 3 C-terminal domain-containing protein [Kineothrix sp. MSJ-39]
MNRKEAEERAVHLVDQMTVEEMASQLRYDAPAIERLHIPAYNWWSEGLHGVARAGTATVFPQAIGLAATFDPVLIEKIGDTIATEARAKYNAASAHGDRDIYKGLTIWSPNVNIFRDPRWGRGHETYGEDPYLTSRLGESFVKGLQGDGSYLKTAACAKHFAVHSGPEKERHHFDAKATRKDMWETYLPAFQACVEAGVESVMGAYNRTNGEPCCANTYLMEEVLRGKWHFEGHYVSDCWAIKDFHENHKVTRNAEESAYLALEKGCDLNCGCTYREIMPAYKKGDLPLSLIRRAAIRLFTTRFLLGMFDKTEYDEIPYETIACKEHLALAKKAAEESIVLLKNDGILPLKKKKGMTIGVIGPNADSREALIGNYHGTPPRYITVLEGIQDYLGEDGRVLYAQGCHLYKDREEALAQPDDRISEAVSCAEHADVVVLCLGLDETLEGEEGDTGNSYASGDKLDLLLPPPQQRLLEAVAKTKKPFIVCLLAGSAMDLNFADQEAAAILQAFYPGAEGGREVARLLFGEYSPSGKLPVTIYRDLTEMPAFTDYTMRGRTYRYLTKKPLYPFGYGLTYSDCVIDEIQPEKEYTYEDAVKDGIEIKVHVENRGSYDTEEVLQGYVKVQSPNEVLHPKLGVFARIHIKAGEGQWISLHISKTAFSTVTEDGERVYDGKKAQIFIGFGQPDERTAELLGVNSLSFEI